MDPLVDTSNSSDGDVVQQFLRNLCEWLFLSVLMCIALRSSCNCFFVCVLRWYSSDRLCHLRCVVHMNASMRYALSST